MYAHQWTIFLILFVFDGFCWEIVVLNPRFLGRLSEAWQRWLELQDIASWSQALTPYFCSNNSYTDNNEKHGTFERCCQAIDKKMNFHCPMCHVVRQIIIIFWRFPSTERLFYSFCSCPDIDRWWQHPSPEHKQAKQYYKSIQHPPKKNTKPKNQTPTHIPFWGGGSSWKRVGWKRGHESQSLLWPGWWLRRCQSALGLAIILAWWHGAGLSGGFAAWGGGNCAVRFFFLEGSDHSMMGPILRESNLKFMVI